MDTNNNQNLGNNPELNSNINNSNEQTQVANESFDEQINNNTNNQQQSEIGNLSQYYQKPVEGQSFNDTAVRRDNRKSLIFVVIFIALGCYIIFTNNQKNGSGEIECINDFESDITLSFDGTMYLKAVGDDDNQYILNPTFDVEFISSAMKFDEVRLKICYVDIDLSSENLHIGGTTSAKMIDSFELYNRSTNKRIKANKVNDLIEELGYHSYGKYTEEAILSDFDDSPSYGYSSDFGEYLAYDLTLQFTNGIKVEADYIIYADIEDKTKLLKVGNKYNFTFEVKKDILDPLKYVITDFE